MLLRLIQILIGLFLLPFTLLFTIVITGVIVPLALFIDAISDLCAGTDFSFTETKDALGIVYLIIMFDVNFFRGRI